MITLAALDIAGTTVQEGGAVYRVLAEVVAEHGRPASDDLLRQWMGADKREALAALTGDPGSVDELHARFVARLHQAYAEQSPTALPGVAHAIRTLRAGGVRVVLTTGFDRQVTDPLLALLDWRLGRDLDGVVCASEAGAGRPAPNLIQHAMSLVDVVDPADVLAAGDTVLDIRAGHAAHAGLVVAVLTGAQTRAELEKENPTHIVDSVSELPALLSAALLP